MTDINLTRKRGDTYPDVFLITSKSTGNPIDITNCTFLLTVDPDKAPVDNTNNLFQLVGNVTDGPGGKVEFAPSAQDTDRIGNFYFDVEMTDGNGSIRTVTGGRYNLVQDITK